MTESFKKMLLKNIFLKLVSVILILSFNSEAYSGTHVQILDLALASLTFSITT